MSRQFQKILDEVRTMTYEKVDNNPDDYRFCPDEPADVKRRIKYINMHMKKAQEFNMNKEVLDCISHKALAYYKLGEYEQCEALTVEQLGTATDVKDDMRVRQALTNLGVLNKMKGKLAVSLDYYNQSLDLAKKRNERWCQARLFNNIANIHEQLAQYPEAIEFHKKRLELATELSDLDGISKASSSLGALYHTTDDLEKAIESYQRVQEVLRKKLKNFDTLADDAAGSDDDFVDLGGDEENEGGEGEDEGGGGEKKKKRRCTIL